MKNNKILILLATIFSIFILTDKVNAFEAYSGIDGNNPHYVGILWYEYGKTNFINNGGRTFNSNNSVSGTANSLTNNDYTIDMLVSSSGCGVISTKNDCDGKTAENGDLCGWVERGIDSYCTAWSPSVSTSRVCYSDESRCRNYNRQQCNTFAGCTWSDNSCYSKHFLDKDKYCALYDGDPQHCAQTSNGQCTYSNGKCTPFSSTCLTIAENGSGSIVTGGRGDDLQQYVNERGGTTGTYLYYDKWITFNGKTELAYCMDPGMSLHNNKLFDCTPLDDAGVDWIVHYNLDSDPAFANLSDWQKNHIRELALRFYSSKYVDITRSINTPKKVAVTMYRQIKENETPFILDGFSNITAFSRNAYDYLEAQEHQDWLDKAFAIYDEAKTKVDSNGAGLDVNLKETVTFNRISKDTANMTATYEIKSETYLTNFNLVCDDKCSIAGWTTPWNGISGTVVIKALEECQNYKLTATYKTSGLQMCFPQTDLEQQILIVDIDEMDDSTEYKDKICTGDCCIATPVIESTPPTVKVNNCCTTGTNSVVEDYKTAQLFCKYEKSGVEVENFDEKCDTDQFEDKKMNDYIKNLNKSGKSYCKVICTEKFEIETPKPITAQSGRYFRLRETTFGTKSPYVQATKRCRVNIQFDEWHKKYEEIVTNLVDAYNNAQKYKALAEAWQASKDARVQKSYTVKKVCTKSSNTCGANDTPDANGNCPHNYTDTIGSAQTKYYYEYPEKEVKYYEIDKSIDSGYNTIKFIKKQVQVSSYKSITYYDISQGYTGSFSTSGCTGSASDDYTNRPNTALNKDPDKELADAQGKYEGYLNDYNKYVKELNKLQTDLDTCDKIFDYYGVYNNQLNVDDIYDYSKMNLDRFEYSQVYVDENGNTKAEVVPVTGWGKDGNGTPTCNVETVKEDVDSPIYASTIYLNGIENITKLKELDENSFILFKNTTDSISKIIDPNEPSFDADKKFTTNKTYKISCYWDEPKQQDESASKKYTLAQSGLTETKVSENVTINRRQYHVFLSTYTGNYETRWYVKGFGESGKFDKYFEQGTTCSGDTVGNGSDYNLSCAIKIINYLTDTGKCNDPDGDETIYYDTNEKNFTKCKDINKDNPVSRNYNFAIVDEKDLFNENTTDENYAYNWLKTDEGKEVLSAIQTKAQTSSNYAPENISYSFTLTPSDMKIIRKYNKQQEKSGGYSDFDLKCEYPKEASDPNSNKSDENDVDKLYTAGSDTSEICNILTYSDNGDKVYCPDPTFIDDAKRAEVIAANPECKDIYAAVDSGADYSQVCTRPNSFEVCKSTFIENLYDNKGAFVEVNGSEKSVTGRSNLTTNTLEDIRNSNYSFGTSKTWKQGGND